MATRSNNLYTAVHSLLDTPERKVMHIHIFEGGQPQGSFEFEFVTLVDLRAQVQRLANELGPELDRIILEI